MNSFDSMIERYKKELIDAKKRSMTQQLKEVTAQEEPLFASAEPQEERQMQKAAAVSASPEAEEKPPEAETVSAEADIQPEKAGVREAAAAATEPEEALPAEENYPRVENESEPQSLGALKVQVFMAGRAYPVSSANVIITGRDKKVYFDGFTDINGAIERLLLPAPKKQFSQSPQVTPPYAQYDIFVSHPRFQSRKCLGVPVFAGVESIQNIQLLPLGTDEADNTDVTESEPNRLLMKGGESNA